jgi:hypothetical protein
MEIGTSAGMCSSLGVAMAAISVSGDELEEALGEAD